MLAAVNREGYSLKHASDELKNDKDIVFLAMLGSKKFFKFSSQKLQTDPLFIWFESVLTSEYSVEQLTYIKNIASSYTETFFNFNADLISLVESVEDSLLLYAYAIEAQCLNISLPKTILDMDII